MRKKDFLRIINEEIAAFDFLGNEQHQQDEQLVGLLEDENFQKQFIIDSITNMRDKIQISNGNSEILTDPDEDTETTASDFDLQYDYDTEKEPLKFNLGFDVDDVEMYSPQGDKIKFIAFQKAPDKIKELFVNSYKTP
jgi:hypothetical protein